MSEILSLAKAYEKYFKIGAAVSPMQVKKHHDLLLQQLTDRTGGREILF